MKPVRLALLGCGTVGSEVVRLLHEQADDLTARIGAPLEIVGIAVRRLGRERVGVIEPARTWLVEALRTGKSVVTANKALLAEDGAALHDAAAEGAADLYYEASVAAA